MDQSIVSECLNSLTDSEFKDTDTSIDPVHSRTVAGKDLISVFSSGGSTLPPIDQLPENPNWAAGATASQSLHLQESDQILRDGNLASDGILSPERESSLEWGESHRTVPLQRAWLDEPAERMDQVVSESLSLADPESGEESLFATEHTDQNVPVFKPCHLVNLSHAPVVPNDVTFPSHYEPCVLEPRDLWQIYNRIDLDADQVDFPKGQDVFVEIGLDDSLIGFKVPTLTTLTELLHNDIVENKWTGLLDGKRFYNEAWQLQSWNKVILSGCRLFLH